MAQYAITNIMPFAYYIALIIQRTKLEEYASSINSQKHLINLIKYIETCDSFASEYWVTIGSDKYITRTNVYTLQLRHNGRDGVSNPQPRDCLLKRLSRRRSKKTSKFRVTGLYEWNSPVTGEFPTQRASNSENVSIWWRHHDWIRIFPENLFEQYIGCFFSAPK